jgi:hypothetical protein
MEDKIEFEPVTKEDFEHWIEGPLTDEEWKNVASEVEGRVENFVDGLLAELVQDYCDGVFSAE